MPTAIKMWEVAERTLRPIADAALSDSHIEADLEGWIAADSEIIGDRILIIDRQRPVPEVGRIDLLGIDREGTLIIIELKRDRAPREAVAQALDYASWIDSANETEIISYAAEYLKRPLEDAFRDYFQDELPELSCQRHKIMLVAPRLDASAERIITYLSERHRVDINAVFFQYARLDDGREVMARTMLVAEESRPPSRTRRGKPSVDSHSLRWQTSMVPQSLSTSAVDYAISGMKIHLRFTAVHSDSWERTPQVRRASCSV